MESKSYLEVTFYKMLPLICWRLGVFLTLILGGMILLIAPSLLEIPLRLLSGWVIFLIYSFMNMRVDVELLLIGTTTFLMLVGFMSMAVWIFTDELSVGVALKKAFKLIILMVMLFTSGLALTGLYSQTNWLLMSADPILVDKYYTLRINTDAQQKLGEAHVRYMSKNPGFPPIGTYDSQGQAQHSWITLLLPHMDPTFAQQIDLTQPWHAPVNEQVMQRELPFFKHQQTSWRLQAPEKYAGSPVAANPFVLGMGTSKSPAEIKDGLSNVFIAGTVYRKMSAWGDPHNYRNPVLGLNQSEQGFGFVDETSVMVIMGDGSVKTLRQSSDNSFHQQWIRLAMPNDGTPIKTF